MDEKLEGRGPQKTNRMQSCCSRFRRTSRSQLHYLSCIWDKSLYHTHVSFTMHMMLDLFTYLPTYEFTHLIMKVVTGGVVARFFTLQRTSPSSSKK